MLQLVRLGKWTFIAAGAALGAAALAWGGATRFGAVSNPYEQVIGTATIDAVSGGKPFELRGESLQRDGSKVTVTLVRTADQGTVALKLGVFNGSLMKITIKFSSGASYAVSGLRVSSDSVGMLGGVNGAALEQVNFSK